MQESDSILETISCNLCGADDSKVMYKGALKEEEGVQAAKVYKSSGNKPSEDTIVKCNRCSLAYVNPRIKAEKILEGYSEGQDETFISQVKGREATFLQGVKFIEKFAKPGRILDVGTAGGSFLAMAKKRGWEVHGCEPNKWLCDWAKQNYGIDITPGTIDSIAYPDGFFDVITLWDVIEHVPNPTAVLQRCHRLLRPGGFLYLNYPDYGSYASKLMGKRWVFLLSVHIYYFTRKTIAKMLEKNAFTPMRFRTHFQTLSVGYLVFRMQPYSKLLYKIGNAFVSLLHLKNFPIKYWLGQSGIIAKKK
jgi:2-polyprenyl-3-methyl-5-hydroxy-6-metoxy-1,4-benzoquinol methylase